MSMSPLTRKLLFALGCIPSRVVVATLPLYMPDVFNAYKSTSRTSSASLSSSLRIHEDKQWFVHLYTAILFIISFAFFYLWYANMRLDAPEGGGTTWWKSIRPIHSLLYLIAGLLSMAKMFGELAAVLLIDVAVGVVAWLHNIWNELA